MSILITGAAGFIGSHLVDALLNKGHSVVGIDNFNDFYLPTIKHSNISKSSDHTKFTLYQGSILDKSCLDNIIRKHTFTAVIHLAAYAGVRPSINNPDLYYSTNIDGTKNILDMAIDNGCKRVLVASSSSVYGNNKKVPFSETDIVDHPISPYAATKKMTEIMAYNYHHLYELEIACLRFFTVYGPRQRPEMAIHKFCRMICNGETIPVYNHGNCLRDYTYVDDIVQGILAILDAKTLTYDVVNLGESQTISTLELIKLLEQECGKKAILNLMESQQGDVEQTFADISHAKSVYGYKPQYPIQKGIKEFVKWYKDEYLTTL